MKPKYPLHYYATKEECRSPYMRKCKASRRAIYGNVYRSGTVLAWRGKKNEG